MATYESPSCSARVSASASTRAKPPDSCGWATDEPLADGSLLIAPCAAASTTAGSAPTAVISGATVLPGTSSSACSRWDGLDVRVAAGQGQPQRRRDGVTALGGELVRVHGWEPLGLSVLGSTMPPPVVDERKPELSVLRLNPWRRPP